MAANQEIDRIKEWQLLRGFTNLLHKENRAWWGTRRWWINALIWPIILTGLLANILFVPSIANLATESEIALAGGITAYILGMGLSVFFEFGTTAVGIGTIILCQDLIVTEKQNGSAVWLLSKPITRNAYILAKLAANAFPILLLLIGLPALIAYAMLSIRLGACFPWVPFLSATGILIIHTGFYLSMTLMLGTLFNNRGAILGISLGSVLGGSLMGSLVKPLLLISPWMLPKIASLVGNGMAIPSEIGPTPLVASSLWSLIFIGVALFQFEKTEF
jgi:ABC-2 type transport system permease protein